MNILEYENYHETKSHSDSSFPCNIYPCTIPLDFKQVPTHWHDETELIIIKKGEGLINVDLKEYYVKAGDIVLIISGQLHSIEQQDNCTMEYENIIFHLHMLYSKQADICSQDYFEPLLRHKILLPVLITEEYPRYSSLQNCIRFLDDISDERQNAYQLAIKGCLLQFFYYLFIEPLKNEEKGHEKKNIIKLKVILKYIEQNYSKKISIEEIAKLCYYSPSHFMKFFKNSMGITFTSYLNDYRLSMASRLLHASSDTILNIAAQTGFDNLSYFNRTFRKKYNMTPIQYRNLRNS